MIQEKYKKQYLKNIYLESIEKMLFFFSNLKKKSMCSILQRGVKHSHNEKNGEIPKYLWLPYSIP